jgi:AcrR family transcriptional regulator
MTSDALAGDPLADERVIESLALERERLLRAARSVLVRSGWWGFKVESVLRQAGLSTRSFYRHFGRKNDLLLALYEGEIDMMSQHIAKAMQAADTPTEQVHAWIRTGIDVAYRAEFTKPAALFALNQHNLIREYPAAIKEIYARLMAPLQTAIQRGIDEGCFDTTDAAADASAIFYLLTGIIGDQAAGGGATSRETVERTILPFVNRALGEFRNATRERDEEA